VGGAGSAGAATAFTRSFSLVFGALMDNLR
jgi:hypothetical protein